MSVATEAFSAVGWLLVPLIVMLTVAVFESIVPSLTLKVNESVPVAAASGVYVPYPLAARSTVPLAGGVTMEKIRVSPSGSLARSWPLTGVP